jgi:diacylglycerol kinase family enzyme
VLVTGFLVLTNTAAGRSNGATPDGAFAVLRSAGDVDVRTTASQAQVTEVLRRLGDRRLVICGGDGSLHTVIAALRREDLLSSVGPIGLIPVGTGNDLARAAGIPLDPVAAAHIVIAGVPSPRELLVDDAGGVVVNAVHVGIGAEAGRAAAQWKPRLGAAAYTVGSVVAGVRSRGWRLRVNVDGELIATGNTPVLMVALALGTSIGGGTPLAPGAAPDDGLVDVVVSFATGPVARARYALQLRRGKHVEREDVHATLARTVTISGQRFPWNADGEVGAPVRRRTWVVEPRAWHLLVPPTSKNSSSANPS